MCVTESLVGATFWQCASGIQSNPTLFVIPLSILSLFYQNKLSFLSPRDLTAPHLDRTPQPGPRLISEPIAPTHPPRSCHGCRCCAPDRATPSAPPASSAPQPCIFSRHNEPLMCSSRTTKFEICVAATTTDKHNHIAHVSLG